MATHGYGGTMRGQQRAGTSPTRHNGLVAFAGIMMLVNGLFTFFTGLMGIFNDHVFVSTPTYFLQFSLTSWGYILLIIGALLMIVGLGVLARMNWARYVGLVLVSIAILAEFASMPYYPLWSIVALAINVFVIWGLTVRPGRGPAPYDRA